MKKQKYKLLSTLLVGAGIVLSGGFLAKNTSAIGNTAFEDENFYTCVVKQFNALYPGEITIATTPSDTVLSDAQLAKMEFLNCSRRNASNVWSLYYNMPSYYELNGPQMTSAAGLEKMTGLKAFVLEGHNLTSIDLSKNTKLTELALGQNNLSEVDLSKNTKLTHLGVHENLTTFNEPTLTELSILNLQGNQLTSIDVSNNKKLGSLFLNNGNRGLKNIDLSQNKQLRTISIDFENGAFVTPYVELGQTDDCKLTAKVPILIKSNHTSIYSTSYYNFNEDTHTITFKQKPVKDLINSGYSRTIQTAIDENGTTKVYFLVLPDSVYTAYDQLSSCVPKSSEENIPVPDTSTGGNGVKTPDTGFMTGENNAKIIGISLLAISGIALVVYLAAYAHHRQKNHIKF